MSKTLRKRRNADIILNDSNMLKNTSLMEIERRGYIVVHTMASYEFNLFVKKKLYREKPRVIFKVIRTYENLRQHAFPNRMVDICAIYGEKKPMGNRYNGYIDRIDWDQLSGNPGRWFSIANKEVKFYKKKYDLYNYTKQ